MSADLLTAEQHAQMERDLKVLLPNGLAEAQAGLTVAPPDAEPKPLPEAHGRAQVPRGVSRLRRFPMGGWVYWKVPARMQRVDQGQDLEVPIGRHIIAPGWGRCIHHLSDGAFPSGFGSPYAVVYIGSGRFAGRLWYLGHCNAEVIPAGAHFHTGAILARPNHSLNSGWGWAEIGWAPSGYPGAWGNGARFHSLFSPIWRWTST